MKLNSYQNHYRKLFIAFLFNLLFVFFIARDYISALEFSTSVIHNVFFILTTTSHFFGLTFLPLLLSYIVLWISKSVKASSIVYGLLTIILLIYLKIDSSIFAQFRYHLNPIVFDLVFGKRASDIFQFSLYNKLMSIGFVLLAIAAQFLFLKLGKKLASKYTWLNPKYTLIGFFTALLFSNILYAWGDANYDRFVMQYKRVLPIYYPLTADDLLMRLNLVDSEKINQNKNIVSNQKQNLVQYPLKKIVSTPKSNKKNILIIAIDSWRFDCMTPEITPNIHDFAEKSSQFLNHKSGANMTTGGIFTLFYGIPATYFLSFTSIKKSPAMIDELLKQDYNINIYSSSTIENPPFNLNAFVKAPNLRLSSDGNTPSERDQDITNDWINDIDEVAEKPFFGFLFYDAAHGFDHPEKTDLPFQPSLKEVDYLSIKGNYNSEKLYNKYKNSLHFIDSEIAKILHKLEEKNLLKNTIVIITSDHGQEFNDNKKGHWQHGGNFSKYQIQVPMIIYDEEKTPQKYQHLSLHYDITPTIMTDILGVNNPLEDYSIGQNIYLQQERDWFLCGYNQKYSVIEKNRITNIYESGNYDITDNQLNTLDEDLNYEIIAKAFQINNSYFVKSKN